MKYSIFGACWLLVLVLTGCGGKRQQADISKVDISYAFDRFDRELFASGKEITVTRVQTFREQYPDFFPLFCNHVIRIRTESDTTIAEDLTRFINDVEVKAVESKVERVYSDTRNLEASLQQLLKYYHSYFPKKPVPAIVAYNSAFNYSIITGDSLIGIGLEMFLGQEEESYHQLGIPKYMSDHFTQEYIPVACAKGWFQSEWDAALTKGDLISQMVYQGKMIYFAESVLPDMNDTIKFGYTPEQLKWCNQQEAKIWGFFIEKKLLFSTDPSEYVKYVNDGPTTSGFPPESPGKIGAWVGYRIVKQFMQNEPDVSLEQLLNESDAVKILEKSKYKPDRNT